ncbi:MAG: DNA adenine methylase [Sulfurimonas sp.]|jgi:DNA adenine methylase
MTAPSIQPNFTKYQPFVKWVGGKRGLLSQIIPLIPKEFNNYFEPFVGGGALFFELYSLGLLKDKKVYLFDINSELINAYNIVKNSPSELIKNLKEFKEKHSKEFYYEIRAWDRDESFLQRSEIERASRFIYLNKTCFNGLYRVNSKGYHNVPIGSYKNPNICDELVIYNASEALQNAIILNSSYKDVILHVKENDFVYFDPPYYPLTPTSSFTSYSEFSFLEKEQVELFEIFKELDKKNCHVFQSNSDTEFIDELYHYYKRHKIILANRNINSNTNKRGKIQELLIRSYKDE